MPVWLGSKIKVYMDMFNLEKYIMTAYEIIKGQNNVKICRQGETDKINAMSWIYYVISKDHIDEYYFNKERERRRDL